MQIFNILQHFSLTFRNPWLAGWRSIVTFLTSQQRQATNFHVVSNYSLRLLCNLKISIQQEVMSLSIVAESKKCFYGRECVNTKQYGKVDDSTFEKVSLPLRTSILFVIFTDCYLPLSKIQKLFSTDVVKICQENNWKIFNI